MHGASDSDVHMVEPATIHSDHIYEEENEESSIGQPQAKTSKTAGHQDQLQKTTSGDKVGFNNEWTIGRPFLGRRSFACLFV